MLTQVKLTNFKCFKQETTFPLSKFNLLTGVNGSGKSTLLQTLLLMRQSIEQDMYTTRLILNGSCVNLGSFYDVRNREVSASEPIFFEFCIQNSETFKGVIRYQLESKNDGMSLQVQEMVMRQHATSENPKIPRDEKSHCFHYFDREELYRFRDVTSEASRWFRLIKLAPHYFKKEGELIPLLRDETQEFSYNQEYKDETDFDYFSFYNKQDHDNLNWEKIHFVSADRIGPQEFYQKAELPKFVHVGTKGELAINLLHKMGEKLVAEDLCLGEDAKTLITQTEAWLGEILSPLRLEITSLKVNVLELLIGGFKPSNVGFGYSSVLPIIVSGLIAQPGEKLIVENPEIHLHPKAQSALIQFLVKVAKTGVQVFVESHSDHILNALRIAVLKKQLTPENVSILYFQQDNQEPVVKIPIQEDGRIETWLHNFFDQMDNDFSVLFGI